MPEANKGSLGWLWLSLVVIALDQLTKWVAVSNLGMYQQVPVIPDLFSFTLAYNTGAAFSLLADAAGWQRWLFAAIAVVVVGLSSRGSRSELGRSNAFADYLSLRYDLGDDLQYRSIAEARLARVQRPATEQCLSVAGLSFDLDEWHLATSEPALDAPLLANPLGSSSDPFRPIDPAVVEVLGMGLERHAIVIEERERALSEMLDGNEADIDAVRGCLAAQEFVDTIERQRSFEVELDL